MSDVVDTNVTAERLTRGGGADLYDDNTDKEGGRLSAETNNESRREADENVFGLVTREEEEDKAGEESKELDEFATDIGIDRDGKAEENKEETDTVGFAKVVPVVVKGKIEETALTVFVGAREEELEVDGVVEEKNTSFESKSCDGSVALLLEPEEVGCIRLSPKNRCR